MLQKKIWAFPVLLSVVHGVVAEAKNMVGCGVNAAIFV